MLPRMGLPVNEISMFWVSSDNGVRSRWPAAVATASGARLCDQWWIDDDEHWTVLLSNEYL